MCRHAVAAWPISRSLGYALGLAVAASVCLALGTVVLDAAQPGPLTRMMGAHILLMNAVAPVLALAIVNVGWRFVETSASSASLASATVLQIALLAAMHVPMMLQAAAAPPALHALMQAGMLGIALWFWLAVLATRGSRRWLSLVALALTAKLFCLLAALLVFAPRLLAFGGPGAHGGHQVDPTLADQQLAGLLMLAVCPLTYVLAGIVIAARWLAELAAKDAQSSPRGSAGPMLVG